MDDLKAAIALESQQFEQCALWLEEHMPPKFMEECDLKTRLVIARHLLSLKELGSFVQIHLSGSGIVLCLESSDADLRILKQYPDRGIRFYRTFVSNAPPFGFTKGALRIALLSFVEKDVLKNMPQERREVALRMLERAKTRDLCQYEIKRNEEAGKPSLQIVLAWKDVPKAGFLYKLAKTIDRHGLDLKKVVATYREEILVLSIGLHGKKGGAAWEETDFDDFLRELCLLKYFDTAGDLVDETFICTRQLTGNEGHLVRNLQSFAHQVLLYADPNLYSFEEVGEGLCKHPELTLKIVRAFEAKFDPRNNNMGRFQQIKGEILEEIDRLDTGQASVDLKRKNILKQAFALVDFTLKTNFYRNNKSAFAFRLDPLYLDAVPYDRKERFPELPFAIFFLRGMHFIGFNIRFKDLARGGVRTVLPDKQEAYLFERNNIFSEAYNLSFTQQKKNKDIPEGGAKTTLLLEPFDVFEKEWKIIAEEMESAGMSPSAQKERLQSDQRAFRLSYLYASQRMFIESFLTLLNCDASGVLLAKDVIDYYKKPEYIYLGPDENMHNNMIDWISRYSFEVGYKPGLSFMSSKPTLGINHKEYGVTSFGVNVYIRETLLQLGIDPEKNPFTIKISGGPDGDVAGNEILNLYKFYPKTAHLIAVTDGSGTLYDPEGVDLAEMARLFHAGLPISGYPLAKLNEKGFLLDLKTKQQESSYEQKTLLTRKKEGQLVQEWLTGSEMNHLYRTQLHQVFADLFMPGGGRPRTLNEGNIQSYLDAKGNPTSRAIVEGANLYLSPGARRALEKLGVFVLKDSSCNKGGVICSSFEVLAGLCLSAEEFLKVKKQYVEEVLTLIGKAAENEAKLLFSTHAKTNQFLTDISDQISSRINYYKYGLLDALAQKELSKSPTDPLNQVLIRYCPPLLQKNYVERILAMPEIHKKAIIACAIASHHVYTKGLSSNPSIQDLL